MKKLIIGLSILLICGTANAEAIKISSFLDKLEFKQGVAYSLADSKLNYISTVEVLKWKGFSLEAGYAGAADNTNHKVVGVLSYDLLNLEKLGVKVPIAKYIDVNVGVYIGQGNLNFKEMGESETDYGIRATFLSIKS